MKVIHRQKNYENQTAYANASLYKYACKKMGKDEPALMETLSKVSTYLGCGLDDIVEIEKGDE